MTERVVLASASRAADGGYLALADLSDIAAQIGACYRIIGGHMVTLLTVVHGVDDQVPLRETLDADFGAAPQVIADPRLVDALHERQYRTVEAANRFVRRHDTPTGRVDLTVDILAPSYRGGCRTRRETYGHLTVDAVPGLALALSRPAVFVDVEVGLDSGGTVAAHLALPDLVSAICIKAFAYQGRYGSKDAVDLYRLMAAAHAAGLRAADWPTGSQERRAAGILDEFFGRPKGAGLRKITAQRPEQARMRAMTRAVVNLRPG